MYVAVIDCSALDALARFLAVLGREDLRISSEQGNPARLVQRRTGSNDVVWATIKKMPFPLHNREFVNRLVCCVDVNGDLLFTTVPVDEVIDYGLKTNTVRGVARNIMRFIHAGVSHCKVTYHMHLDAGGHIPTFVVNAKLPLALEPVVNQREEFQRDSEIDKLERDQLVRVIKDEPQTYTAEEGILINKVHAKLGMLEWEHFEELESPDHLVKIGKIFIDGSCSAVGRASVTFDASMEACMAWQVAKMSREEVRTSLSLEKSLTKINNHHNIYLYVVNFGVPGFQTRQFLTSMIWKRQGETLVMVADAAEHTDIPPNPAYIQGTTTTYTVFEKLPPLGEVPQTRATFTQQVDLMGSIPKFVVNGGVVKQAMFFSVRRLKLERSLEIDGATRARNVEMITGHAEQYSGEEKALLKDGEKHFTDFQETKAKSLEIASPLTTAKIAHKSGDMHAWGRSTTTVRARPEEVLAFMWDTMRRSARQEDDLEKSVEEQVNGHNALVYCKKRTPKIIHDRDFLARCVWKKEGEGFVLVTSPEESEARPITGSVRRGKYPSAMKIKRKSDKETTLEYVIHLDAGGFVPSFIMNFYTASNLSYVTGIQEYFQELRGLEEWDADDARAVGEVMCINTKAEKHHEKGENKQSARMRELFKKHSSLSEIGRRYEFFEGMMARVVRNTLKPAGDVKSKLFSVSLKEGETIGRGLAMALACNLTGGRVGFKASQLGRVRQDGDVVQVRRAKRNELCGAGLA